MGVCCSKEERNVILERRKEEYYDGDGDGVVGARVGDGGARVRLEGSCRLASMHSQQGTKGVNQDAMTMWEDFTGDKDNIFCGVFDGHGPLGHKVARHVRDVLPSKLSSELKSLQQLGYNENGDCDDHDDDGDDNDDHIDSGPDVNGCSHPRYPPWKASFVKAFKEMDKELSHVSNIDCICSGTTAVSLMKQKEHLVIANLGDSRAVLATRDDADGVFPVQLTVDLKPNLPSEAKRITSCQGRVFALEEEPDVPRLWLPDENCPGLAMARAFGDFCLKDFGLISVPQVSYRKLTEKDEFVVLATDGVWDVLSNKEVVKIVSSVGKRSDAAKQLVDRAVRSWKNKHPTSKIDDCAVICLFLKSPTSPTKVVGTSEALANGTKSRELSFSESFKTALTSESASESFKSTTNGADDAKDEWTALDGVSRVNSLLKIPRLASVMSWRKKSVKVEEDKD